MVVLLYAVEVEILDSLEARDRDQFLREAAEAYRARSRCLQAMGRESPAQADQKRAEKLIAEAAKLSGVSRGETGGLPSATGPATSLNPARVINGWTEAVTLTVDGVTYDLAIGEQRSIPMKSAAVSFSMRTREHQVTGTLEAGRSYTIGTGRQ
jgi:hypothetical protein